ncbi:acyl-CoA N-acyltransferase [Annulohypoxylon moriforme]|nr:acyl-CoA N-acyltransferase [Annulohypoxylon moriforme]
MSSARVIHEINVHEAENIVRNIFFPAMEADPDPLHRVMFPSAAEMTERQRSEIVQWYSGSLEDALERQTGNFLQICTSEDTPVGFCGWRIEPSQPGEIKPRNPSRRDAQNLLPETLDVEAWTSASRVLRQERERTLKTLDTFCRLTFMAVRPDAQRQGFGSQLLQSVCNKIDERRLPAFVMASPAGVRLYQKLGFEAVGKVEMPTGTITSMFRPAAST